MAKHKDPNLPPEALNDPFGPPDPPRLVRCLHCDQTYMSSLMHWRDGLWACGIDGCGGVGYHIDIFDADDPFWIKHPQGDPTPHEGHDVRYALYQYDGGGFETLFCKSCDEWIDPKCGDPKCGFCSNRPEKPSMMSKEDMENSMPYMMSDDDDIETATE
ncbi:MAG TPA: hypothetical protein VM223_09160 [Planctomycetota bacterium]|nr:hypothetical protein [Planctomycetota bacterium]